MLLRRPLLLAAALLGALATSSPEETAPVPSPPPMEQPIETRVAQLVDAIAAEPTRAEELLNEAGMTEPELKALLYAIARDPGRTEAYESARRR